MRDHPDRPGREEAYGTPGIAEFAPRWAPVLGLSREKERRTAAILGLSVLARIYYPFL